MTARERWACDTSVAVASLDPSHDAHAACRRALVDCRPALAGHAAFETYSVLTRLPVPLRLRPAQAVEILDTAFPTSCWLSGQECQRLRTELAALGVAGGSVYDALVGRAAAEHERTLLTRDRRAQRTYRTLGVAHVLVE